MKLALIEDHDNLRFAMKSFLEGEGYNVLEFACAEEIYDSPFIHTVAAYIVDLNLPGEDGLSLVERLRERHPNAVIIIASARVAIDERVIGYEKGADVYLTKPVDNAELVAVLNAHLRKNVSTEVGISLDVKKQKLFIGENWISLTAGETRVLFALSISKNNYLDYWQLMQQFDPKDEYFNTSQLHMRMSRLRKKVWRAGFEGEVFKSERSKGYRLQIDTVHLK